MEAILITLFWLFAGQLAAGIGVITCGDPGWKTIIGTVIMGPFGFVCVGLALLLSDKDIK